MLQFIWRMLYSLFMLILGKAMSDMYDQYCKDIIVTRAREFGKTHNIIPFPKAI